MVTLLSYLYRRELIAITLLQLDDSTGLYDIVPASVWAALLFTIGIAALMARRYVSQNAGGESTESIENSADESSDVPTEPDSKPSTPKTVSTREGVPDGHLSRPEALDVARELINAGAHSEAVKISYDAVRSALSGQDDDTRTLWEFYDDVASNLSRERADALERITEAQEQTQFAPTAPDKSTAKAAVESAARCVGPAESPDRKEPTGTESSVGDSL